MTNKTIWVPKTPTPQTDYGTLDRPEENLEMFNSTVNSTYTHEYSDYYTGKDVNFGRTLSGGDNKMTNLSHCWRHTSGHGQAGAKCKKNNYISFHLGTVPNLYTQSEIKEKAQHILPGYVGVRFQYRWPNDNSRNYWSNSPVHINDMMLHYYNPKEDRLQSYAAKLQSCSESNDDFWPDRYVKNDSRRSNTWKGCYWTPEEGGARSQIRNNQLCMIGMSVEMKYSDRGSATHSRCMDIRNLTPLWNKASEANCAPILCKKRTNAWLTGSSTDIERRMEIYLV